MIKGALQYLVGLAVPTTVEAAGRTYSTTTLLPVHDPAVKPLQVSSLSAFEDYLRDDPDQCIKGSGLESMLVHVVAHNEVHLISRIFNEWEQRHSFLVSKISHKDFAFGRYLPIEEFMISLQTFFVQDETTAKLMQVVGNIVDEASITLADDGVTQNVTAKTGIARVSTVNLPNPVELAPYRTFRELDQPSSKYVFRLKKGDGGPTAALFEADGGNWQDDCRLRIRKYLKTSLPAGTIILE